jgi:CRP-like cAMP-binding protein
MYQRSQSTSAGTNSFLGALPDAEYKRLSPHLKKVSLHQGQVLHEAGSPPQSVYFLTSGIASLTLSSEEGKEMELSIVGDEGILGERAIFAGNGLQLIRCAMITNGSGYQMPPDVFHQEFNRGGVLQKLVLSRLESRILEASQIALCNQMHTLEQRLCRWLLTFADRLHTEEIPVTQELASQMLGVRRAGVTLAARTLRDAGLIDYSRGRITILDRAGLEEKVCECYEVIRKVTQPSSVEGRLEAASGRRKDRVHMGNQTPPES